MCSIKIGDRIVGDGYPIYIIAEVGSNFDGDINRAKKLVDLSVDCGCDAVKFQSFLPDKIICKEAFNVKSAFQAKWDKPVYEVYEEASFPREWHQEIYDYCKKKKIDFFSSPYDTDAIDMLDDMGVIAHKVGSGEISWPERLKYFGKTGKPILLGTGAATLAEIDEAVRTIKATGNNDLILLQCVTNYPSPFEDANLKVLNTLKTAFSLPVGYSDHTPGSTVPLGAVALGACVIEKHFTDDKKRNGPDHPFAMDVQDMKKMVDEIRILEKAMGTSVKKVAESEKETVVLQRRSLFAAKNIEAGEVFTSENVSILRPQLGIMPKDFGIVIGRLAKCKIKQGDPILWDKIA